jgi:hypothetical protein
MFALHLYIQRFFSQAVAIAFGTGGAATVAAEQHPVLNLVQVLFHFAEKIVDAIHMLVAFPEYPHLFGCKVGQWFMNREVEPAGASYKIFFPFAQLLSFPGRYAAFIYAQPAVRASPGLHQYPAPWKSLRIQDRRHKDY